MVLLLQLNAELPDRFPGHERRIYVLSCKKKSCRRKEGSIRAIRGVRISPDAAALAASTRETKSSKEPPPPAPKASEAGIGEALFGVKPSTTARANPFASASPASSSSTNNPFAPKGASTTSSSNPFAPAKPAAADPPASQPPTQKEVEKLPKTFAETLSLNNPQAATSNTPPPAREAWPSSPSDLPSPYPVRWIADAEYETLDSAPAPLPHANTQIMDIDAAEGSGGGGGGKEDKEVFESSHDSVFQKFADRIGQNPEQCIRYEFLGQPLLYSKNDAVGKLLYSGSEKVGPVKGIPRCNNCGSGRVFEVQLAPHAIQELESEIDDMDGMDWGTIIVGVCDKDCQEKGVKDGDAGYVEEWAGVQWEELSVKR